MKQEEKIRLLLMIQEHPEDYTDEQITQMLADDPELAVLMEQLAMTKRAFVKQEADKEHLPMDDLWEQFATAHTDELEALESHQERESSSHSILGSKMSKVICGVKRQSRVAAVFIGIILTASITFAAIHLVRIASTPKEQPLRTEHPVSAEPVTTKPTDTIRTDTTTKTAPKVILESIVFDDVRLDEILPQIATYYHTEVSFQNDAPRQLRFFFVWKREDGLEHAIEKLNRFESLSLRLDGNTIIVE